jgi:hypothetical protein
MRLRKVRRAAFVFLDEPVREVNSARLELRDKGANPEMELQKEQLSQVLKREIQRLPPLLRSVLVMRDVNERSTQDVADALGQVAIISSPQRAAPPHRRRRLRDLVVCVRNPERFTVRAIALASQCWGRQLWRQPPFQSGFAIGPTSAGSKPACRHNWRPHKVGMIMIKACDALH